MAPMAIRISRSERVALVSAAIGVAGGLGLHLWQPEWPTWLKMVAGLGATAGWYTSSLQRGAAARSIDRD